MDNAPNNPLTINTIWSFRAIFLPQVLKVDPSTMQQKKALADKTIQSRSQISNLI